MFDFVRDITSVKIPNIHKAIYEREETSQINMREGICPCILQQ